MKLLVDMNLSPRWITLLNDQGLGAILAATHGDAQSVVQLRAADVNSDVVGARVVSALRQMESQLEAGALLTLDPSGTRLRLLPLPRRQ